MTIKRFTKGNVETVRRMNELVDAINRELDMSGDEFIRLTNNQAGITFRLNIPGLRKRLGNKIGGGGGGGSSSGATIQFAEITQAVDETETEYEVELIDSTGTLSGTTLTIDRAIGYEASDASSAPSSDNTDIRNWAPRYHVGDIVQVAQHFDGLESSGGSQKWFITSITTYIGAPAARSIDFITAEDNRIAAVWK